MSKLTDYEGRTSCGCPYINQPDPGAHYPECLYRINSKAQPVSAKPAGEVPEVLLTALRQYRHNYGSEELIAGYEYDETNRIVARLNGKGGV